MKTFGIDIDSRDTSELLDTAKKITKEEITTAKKRIQKLFSEPIPDNDQAERSIRLYLALKKMIKKIQMRFLINEIMTH